MADPRTFTLIGEFKDGITPELEKINKQLAALKANFSGIGSRKNTGFRGATNDIGKLVSAHKNLTSSVKEVDGALRSTLGTLQQYRKEMGKASAATRAFQKSGAQLGGKQFSQNMDAANRSAQAYLKTLQQINAENRRQPRNRMGGGGMGGGFQPPRPPRGGMGGYGGPAGGMRPPAPSKGGGQGPGGFHMAEFGFAYTLGNAIAQPIQNAVVTGFQIGVGFMTKPFEYFANRLGERMQDELSDLKAAGGFFSMAKRQESPFVKSFAEAIQFTQENNKVMDRLAASLPGKTQDYIEVSKRISDSIARTVLNDRAATMKMAEQIRAGDIRTYGAKSITEMSGSEATKKTIQVLLGDLTKDTVLAGMGGRAGAGGAMGAYGLPQLSERMISQDEVSMGQMQRYSAIFSDPMIMDALQRNINKINATSKNSADRLKAIASMYKEIVTPELVERYRRTLAGVQETFNTAIFGEENGLFGLGRKMEGLGIKFNEYGQMLDKQGEVTTKLAEAAREDLAIYDLFRDILVNVGQVLAPIVENLSMIYDPLKQLGLDLNKAREATYKILQSFNYYKKGMEEFSKTLKGVDKQTFDATRDLRAALATIGNVMRYFKVIGEGDFAKLMTQLKDPKANMGQILKSMVDQFLTSDIAAKVGEFIGTIIGTVLSEVAKVTGFLSGRIASSNKLFDGLKKGFEDAGGTEAIKAIFRDVFKSLFNVLIKVMTLIPLEGYMLMGAMLVIPAAVQGLGMLIAQKIVGGLGGLQTRLGAMLTQMFTRVSAIVTRVKDSMLGVKPVTVTDLGSTTPITDPRRMLPPAQETALATTVKPGPLAKGMNGFAKFFTSFGNYIKGVGPRFMGFFKGFLGKLSILGAVITSITSLFQGKDLATSLAKGAGPLLGAALGAALIPFLGPIGPMIGSAIGGWIGSMDAVTEPLAAGIRSIFGTLQTTFGFLGQIGSDLGGMVNGLVRMIPGVSAEFNALRLVITALLSPFRLLELMIIGLYEGYLRLKEKFFGLDAEEKTKKTQLFQQRMEKTAALELDFKQAYNKKARAEYQKELDSLRARGKGEEERARIVEKALKQIDTKLKEKDKKYTPPADTYATKTKTQKETSAKKTVAPAKADLPPVPSFWQGVQSTISSESQKFAKGVQDNITKTWQDIQTGQIFFDWAKSASQSWTQAKTTFNSIIAQANAVWSQFTTWLTSLPGKLQGGYNTAVAGLNNLWNQFSNWFVSLPGKLQASLSSALAGLQQAWNSFTAWFTSLPGKFRSAVSSAFANIGSVTAMLAAGIRNWLKNAVSLTLAGWKAGEPAPPKPTAAQAMGSPGTMLGSLGEAVSYEQKHKPPGSDLVVANTSETVIPAAGGNQGSMVGFVAAFRDGLNLVASVIRQTSQQTDTKLYSGFQMLVTGYKVAQDRQVSAINRINSTLVSNQQQTNARLSKLETKFTTPGMAGGLGGAAAGGGDTFTPIAQRYGLQMTSGYRPGDPGWHGANRARDFSNGTGPTPQMMQFAQFMASNYGSNLKELIYTPLGFSIKNGQKVPPYAQGSHYNHVHVAYAMGAGMPAFFQEQKDAVSWEKKHLGPGVKSITTNSAELAWNTPAIPQGPYSPVRNFGSKLNPMIAPTTKDTHKNPFGQRVVPMGFDNAGYVSPNGMQAGGTSGSMASAPININAPITINQQPGQDADQLASIVALKIGEAVADARAASIFV